MADISERRKHKRIAVIEGIAEPVEIHFPPPFYQDPIVGQIINISSGGLGLVVVEPLPKFFTFSLYISLRGIEPFEIKGKVIRLENIDGHYIAGISFTEIDEPTVEMLDLISDDYNKCRKKRAEGDKFYCFEECMFGTLCDKKGKSAKVHISSEKSSGIIITDVKQEAKEEIETPAPEDKVHQEIVEKKEASAVPLETEVPKVKTEDLLPKKQEIPATESPSVPLVSPISQPEISAVPMVESSIVKTIIPKKISRKNVLSIIVLFFLTVAGTYLLKDKMTKIILDRAEKKLLIPEYEAAVKNYKIILKYSRKNTAVRLKLAQTYTKMRMYANAEREYKEVLSLQADNLTALLELGKIELKLNRLKNAESYLIKAKFLSRDNPDVKSEAKVYLGICYEKEKDYDGAMKEFSDISTAVKLPEDVYLPIGKVFGLKGNFKTAILFLGYVNLPKTAVEYFEMGIVKNETEPDEAVVNFLKAIAKKNGFAEAYEWLGFLYRKKALYDASLDAYREALNINSQSARVLFNIAQLHALKDDASPAIAALDKAVSLDRTYIELARSSYEFNEIKNTVEFKKILRRK